ncbi:MAG: type II secretion system F family protein [Patescibacteria group bacterium]
MPQYRYRVRGPDSNKIESGSLEATSTQEALKHLKGRGYLVLEITDPISGSKGIRLFGWRHRVPLVQRIIFTRQLSVMIKAGLAVTKALAALARQSESEYFRQVISEIVTGIQGGHALSQMLDRYPKLFPQMYVAVVRAGEQTGQLSEVLTNLAEQQEKEAELISKVKGAMIYPAVILVALFGVIILVVFMVIPSLEAVFADTGITLPLQTRFLLGLSKALRGYYYIILPVMVLGFFGLRRYFKTNVGTKQYDRWRLKIPVFGGLTKKVYMARFSRTLSMLVKASLPILVSIQIIQKTIRNSLYEAAFERISAAVESGQALSRAIDREPLFPPMVSQLTNLGEESGNLESVLGEIASFYDKEVDAITRNLTTLLEPILLLIMGAGVAFVAMAVLGPIYGLVQAF